MTETTQDSKLKRAFANIVSQSPGIQRDQRDFKILKLESDVYILALSGTKCSVFTIFPEQCRTLPNAEYGMTAFEYLCCRMVPKEGVKEARFSFCMSKRLSQAARNFASRSISRFNIQDATQLLHQLHK